MCRTVKLIIQSSDAISNSKITITWTECNITVQLCCPGRCCQPSLVWLCNRDQREMTFGGMTCILCTHPALPCSVSCRGLMSENCGGVELIWRTHRRWWIRPLCVITVPAQPGVFTTGPDLHTGSWQTSCDLQDLVLTGPSLSLLLSAALTGNAGLQWNAFVPWQRQYRSEEETVICLPAAYRMSLF